MFTYFLKRKNVFFYVKTRKFAGPWATGVFEKATSSTIDQKPGPLGHRALALGGIWEGDLLPFLLIFMLQKTIFIFIAKISKKRGFGEAKMAPKTDFFELWGSLFDNFFHITFCINFFMIFYRFLKAQTLKNINFP